MEPGCAERNMDFRKTEVEYFRAEGWTGQNSLRLLAKIAGWRKRGLVPRSRIRVLKSSPMPRPSHGRLVGGLSAKLRLIATVATVRIAVGGRTAVIGGRPPVIAGP